MMVMVMSSSSSAGVLPLLAVVLALLVSSCSCSQQQVFYVGEKDGWVVQPSEGYDDWAARNKFHVHDKLVFKYKEGKDSVLLVSEYSYMTCTKTGPFRRMTSGESVFEFDNAGHFYFISGKGSHCKQGQKLDVEVIADGSTAPAPESSAAPAPAPESSAAPAPAPSASSTLSGAPFVFMGSLLVGLGTLLS